MTEILKKTSKRKNHYQLTPAQIRTKVKHFWKDPVAREQYELSRKERGMEELNICL